MTTSPLANPTATRELLEEFGLATKHRLGQNFLIDNHVIERICELAELAGDERVLEVGPGVGTLTLALLQEAACVTSIEADPELLRVAVEIRLFKLLLVREQTMIHLPKFSAKACRERRARCDFAMWVPWQSDELVNHLKLVREIARRLCDHGSHAATEWAFKIGKLNKGNRGR